LIQYFDLDVKTNSKEHNGSKIYIKQYHLNFIFVSTWLLIKYNWLLCQRFILGAQWIMKINIKKILLILFLFLHEVLIKYNWLICEITHWLKWKNATFLRSRVVQKEKKKRNIKGYFIVFFLWYDILIIM